MQFRKTISQSEHSDADEKVEKQTHLPDVIITFKKGNTISKIEVLTYVGDYTKVADSIEVFLSDQQLEKILFNNILIKYK